MSHEIPNDLAEAWSFRWSQRNGDSAGDLPEGPPQPSRSSQPPKRVHDRVSAPPGLGQRRRSVLVLSACVEPPKATRAPGAVHVRCCSVHKERMLPARPTA